MITFPKAPPFHSNICKHQIVLRSERLPVSGASPRCFVVYQTTKSLLFWILRKSNQLSGEKMITNRYAANRGMWTRCLVLVALFALSLSACSTQAAAEAPTPTPLPTPIIPTKPTYTVTKGDVARKMEFTGRIVPVVQEELYFKTAGRIDKVLAKKGDVVKKDQILANLEGGNNALDLRRAEINLEMAKINLKLTENHTDAWSADYPLVIGLKKYDVELAQLALEDMQSRVDATEIKSTVDGTVLSIYLTEGTAAEAYKAVAVVADLSSMEISAELTEKEMTQLTEGLAVEASPVSAPGKVVAGTIRKLPYPYGKAAPAKETDTEDKTTRVTLTGTLEDLGLAMGDLVHISAVLEQKPGVLWLPPQAVRNFEGRTFVVVKDGDTQRRVDVKVGISGDDRVEILDGLTEGQTVVAP
jgi:membrane fusion protein, macrolide-specific efflux system